jgi:hypothetical protein
MLSVAVACLPTAGSLLLLEALFMQISGMSLAFIWPCRLCYLEFFCEWAAATSFPFPSTLVEVTLHLHSQACVFVYTSRGKWVFPPSPLEFSSYCSWLLGSAAAPASCHVCLQLRWEVGLPPSPVEFSSLCHSHKLSHSWFPANSPESMCDATTVIDIICSKPMMHFGTCLKIFELSLGIFNECCTFPNLTGCHTWSLE